MSGEFNKIFVVVCVCFVFVLFCCFIVSLVLLVVKSWGGGCPVRAPRPDKASTGTAVLSHAHVERQRSSTTGCDVRRQGGWGDW